MEINSPFSSFLRDSRRLDLEPEGARVTRSRLECSVDDIGILRNDGSRDCCPLLNENNGSFVFRLPG